MVYTSLDQTRLDQKEPLHALNSAKKLNHTDRPTDRPTDRQTDIAISRAPMELKIYIFYIRVCQKNPEGGFRFCVAFGGAYPLPSIIGHPTPLPFMRPSISIPTPFFWSHNPSGYFRQTPYLKICCLVNFLKLLHYIGLFTLVDCNT